MSKGLYFVTFLMGAAAGSAVTWYVVKKRYEEIAQEDFESRREVAIRREETEEVTPEPIKENYPNPRQSAEEAVNKPSIMDYAAKLQEAGYVDYANGGKAVEKVEEDNEVEKEPYVIAPENFGEFDEYEKISLTYYSDGVLADDSDEIIDDVGTTVGEDFAEHFGEYEDDSVFVRNDMRVCDYEILRDERTYEEVSGHKPRRVEVR